MDESQASQTFPTDDSQNQAETQTLPIPEDSQTSVTESANVPVEAKTKKPKAQAKAAPNADRPPGKSLLPTARVQKIMKADKELPSCNKEAVFLISVATEEFIKRLGQAGQQQATREKRTTVQRKDVVTAVRRSDEFVFLEEILAATVTQAAAPTTVKRKTKATVPVAGAMSIKDAFGKGGGKAADAGQFKETTAASQEGQDTQEDTQDQMEL